MRTRRLIVGVVVVALLAAVGFDLAFAQDAPRRQRRDPAQMRRQFMERYMTRIKETLQVEDEDWKVLKPRIEKAQTLSREASGAGGMRMFGGRRGGRRRQPAGEAATEQSAVAKAMQALQKTLENKDATAVEIKAKLKALREAREKAKQELAKAMAAVRELVTQRQEAQLVVMGILD